MTRLSQGRIADLHPEMDRQGGQNALQGLRLKASDMKQRRAVGSPDASILGGRLLGPSSQYAKVQNEPPQKTRRFDDARIAQELPQIAPQGRDRRLIRRTELNEQNTSHEIRNPKAKPTTDYTEYTDEKSLFLSVYSV